MSASTASRELTMLRAAIRAYHAEKTLDVVPIVTLPAAAAPRTRSEAAAFLRAARRHPERPARTALIALAPDRCGRAAQRRAGSDRIRGPLQRRTSGQSAQAVGAGTHKSRTRQRGRAARPAPHRGDMDDAGGADPLGSRGLPGQCGADGFPTSCSIAGWGFADLPPRRRAGFAASARSIQAGA